MGAALVVAAASLPAAAYQRPGRTELVSLAYDGTQGIRGSDAPSISADGRYVAFISFAENLVPGSPVPDPNYQLDVFVRDRQARTTERVPVGIGGEKGNNVSDSPSISGDGRYVAFRSFASNLVPGDTNGTWDIFVRDRVTGATERVSVGAGGAQGNGESFAPSINADGRYVVFWSVASNLVPGDTNGTADVFVRDRQAGTTERASVGTGGAQGNGDSLDPFISLDGRYVAFTSDASNLVPGDTNGTADVFVRDRQAGTTERASMGAGGAQGNGPSYGASISSDGQVVAFNSEASNLIPSDTNDGADSPAPFQAETFVRDREAGTTERVSVTSDGAQWDVFSWQKPAMSADGRYVAFNHYSDRFGGIGETYVRDRETATTEVVSVHPDPYTGGPNTTPSITADGRYVAFHSRATNLVPEDTNGRIEDVFVRDRGPSVGVGELLAGPGGDQVPVSGWATFSGQEMASAADPPNDGAAGADEAGAELTEASLTYRHEEEDLLVRMGLASLPSPPVPGVSYGLEFVLAGARYQARATAPDSFALYRCDLVCTEQAPLSGGVGTTGVEVLVSVPLSVLGAGEGAALTGVRAFTAALESTVVFDEVALPNAVIPASSVRLGIAPVGTPEGEVAFDTEAALGDGAFSGAVEASSLPGGQYEAWAQACLGAACGSGTAGVHIASADLGLTKADSRDPAPTGRQLTYTLIVTNNGPDAASDVTVTDELPASVTLVSATSNQGSCTELTGTVTCTLGAVPNEGSVRIEIVVTPRSAGTITNTASVTASTRDSAAVNNTASQDTTVCRVTSRRTSIPCG